MLDRDPDYVILSGGGSIADLSGLDIEDPDRLVKDWLEKLKRKAQDGTRGTAGDGDRGD